MKFVRSLLLQASLPVVLFSSAFFVQAEDKPAAVEKKTETPPVKKEDVVPEPRKKEVVIVRETVVVTASRISTPAEETGVSITVLEGPEQERVFQNHQLGETLRQSAGITVSQSGQKGDFTSVFTRGGNSNQTLFLYDGWKVNRQGGNFDLGRVDPVLANRVEIARGPASSLFGTDAVTGTINVLTEKGEGDPLLRTSAAGGTYGTDRETLSMQGNYKKFSYNVGSSRYHRDEATFNNSELELYNYAARFDFQINADHALKAVLRGSDSHKGFYEDSGTGYGPAVEPADPNDQYRTRDTLVGLEYKGHILPIWDTTLRLGYYAFRQRINSEEENPTSPIGGFAQSVGKTKSKETRPSLDWQNDITAYQSEDEKIKYVITAGASIEDESFEQTDTQFGANVDVSRTNWSVFTQHRLELFNRAFITAGVRREENGQFGDFTTARGDVAILIPETCTRIHGSVGNAFRAPSFYEFFSAFGNPNLQPEENFAYDVGIEQHFWKRRASVGVTWFHNDFSDLVDFSLDTGTFDNLKEAASRGFEINAQVTPIKEITFRGTATLLHTEDASGRQLLRRPEHTYTAQIIAHPIEGLDLSLDFIHVGGRVDLGPMDANPFARVHNESYNRVDAAASYSFYEHWRAFGRVENIFNKSYEDVRTFPSPGSNVLVGIEFSWRF